MTKICIWFLKVAVLFVIGNASIAYCADDAAGYPARPIRIVIGFTPGGLPDVTARLMGPKLLEGWKQQVVVDNRPGAGGIIGTDIVAKANPDGYTLLSISPAHTATPVIRANLPYDTIKDFTAITLTSRGAFVLVVAPASGVKSVRDLIAMIKAKPGQLNFASAGVGSGTHFAAELFNDLAGLNIVHVAYKGIPEAMTESVAGRVQYFMPPLASAASLIKDGRLLALAVTGKRRTAGYDDIQTIAESGVAGYEWDAWSGLLAPVKTPRAIVNKLNHEVVRIMNLPDIKQRMIALGAESATSTPEEFQKMIVDGMALTARIARKAGIKAE
jgi:tripartite-type tricarboxylate transporter receptor subunit TctC